MSKRSDALAIVPTYRQVPEDMDKYTRPAITVCDTCRYHGGEPGDTDRCTSPRVAVQMSTSQSRAWLTALPDEIKSDIISGACPYWQAKPPGLLRRILIWIQLKVPVMR